ncbi:retinol dehydrogenase family protein [Cryptosporidium serpentis]
MSFLILVYVLLQSLFSEPIVRSFCFLLVSLKMPFIIYYLDIYTFPYFTTKITILVYIGYSVFILIICRKIAQGKNLPQDILSKNDIMYNKTVIITGSNCGIGYETAKQLAIWGVSKLIMCCRDIDKAVKAKDLIVKSSGIMESKIVVIECDLSDLHSINKAAQVIMGEVQKVDILINNAGVMSCPYKLCNNLELQFMTNYLGHFYLTQKLLPLILSSKTRIINLSSIAHLAAWNGFNLEEVQNIKSENYSPSHSYSISKICNIYFTRELQKRYGKLGVNAFSVHPGCVLTCLSRHIDEYYSMPWSLFIYIIKLFFKTAKSGAQTTLYCCITPLYNLAPGAYYSECNVSVSSPISLDMHVSEELWDISDSLCKKIV